MALISCPVCAKEVSAAAVACPNCGHPIARPSTPKTSRPVIIQNRSSSAFAGVLLILVIGGIIAAVTKPNESELRNALLEKYGLIYGVGAVAEKFGLMNVKYHDYIVFSRLSVQIGIDPERTVAFGVFGKTVIPDVPLSLGPNGRSTSRTSQPISSESVPIQPVTNDNSTLDPAPPPPRAKSTPQVDDQPVYSEEQMRQGLQNARQTLVSQEMRQKASDTFSGRHPFSRIEQCNDPNIQSFNMSLYGEEIVGTYTCRMRGTIAGRNTFVVTVRIRGAITFQNGVFIRQVVDADVIGDSKEN